MQRLSRIHTQSLNYSYNLSLIRQRSDEPLRQASTGAKLVKNLAAAESQKQAAGMSPPSDQESIKGKILEFLWKLEKDGRTQGTIRNYNKWFSRCLKHDVNIFDPEEVKGYLAKAALRERTKITIVGMLRVWYRFLKIHWEPPEYIPEAEIPFIPTEQELDQLIAGCGKKTATYLQLMKETGARAGEISKLTWADIDFQQRIVRIKPEKGSLPRMLPLSLKATEMLNNIPKTSDRIFLFADDMRSCFYVQRKRIARKLGNPRLLHISFHTFRHWKGTMEYHKTKDIFYVKELLGHKSIQSTQVYIHIERALYPNGLPDEYHVKVAKTQEEISQLLENGFEYVLQKDGLAFFRKRK
jgi:integrase